MSESRPVDVLLLSQRPLWPLDQGYRVHGTSMAQALAAMGVGVAIASLEPTTDPPQALGRLMVDWPDATRDDRAAFLHGWAGPATALRHRIADHQGVDPAEFAGALTLVRRLRPRVVVALGQHGPMMLRGFGAAAPEVTTAWYAADEPVYYQLSCLRREGLARLPQRARHVALYSLLHASFTRGIDLAIGVSPLDTRLLRLAGARRAVTIRNGVDTGFYRPNPLVTPRPRSLAFWGRMDFEPNVDAVRWFSRAVWPRLRRRVPDATWRIVGKGAGPEVRALGELPGVEVVGEVPDVREHALSAAVTVLPMRCGGGIKNKLLEAAAMARPIVASPRAVRGLDLDRDAPILVARSANDWCDAVERLWADASRAARFGAAARTWVSRRHTWRAAATQLLDALPQPAIPATSVVRRAA